MREFLEQKATKKTKICDLPGREPSSLPSFPSVGPFRFGGELTGALRVPLGAPGGRALPITSHRSRHVAWRFHHGGPGRAGNPLPAEFDDSAHRVTRPTYDHGGVGRGCGVGRARGIGLGRGVGVGVGVGVGLGA